MNKIEHELVEQLIHQLIAINDPLKRVYLKSFDMQVTPDKGYTERRYLISILEANE